MSQDCVERWQSSQQQTEGEILTVAELEYKMVPPTVPGKYENQPSPVNYFTLEALIFFRLPKRLRTRSRPRLGHMGQPADAYVEAFVKDVNRAKVIKAKLWSQKFTLDKFEDEIKKILV